ncbi:ParM/StbA family protein [Clostridium perfringens]|nr:ParM/StbA family protein [Clostridium perfringens]MDK0983110.1 ParM/StbA family protein [Clostridium perfringens]
MANKIKTINVGIDSGFGYGIGVFENGEACVPSYITEISENKAREEAMNITLDDIKGTDKENSLIVKFSEVEKSEDGKETIVKKEKYFFVGDVAVKVNPNTTRALTTRRINNPKHLVQVMSLIGLATGDFDKSETEINVNLGMGLPIKLKNEGDNLRKWLKGSYILSFLYNEGELIRKINIDTVSVLPQALAPVFSLDDFVGKKIVSVDLGHYTNDMCFWTGGSKRDDLDYCGDGFHQCYNEMENLLLKNSNVTELTTTIKEKNVQEALETGVVTLRGKNKIEVAELQKEILEEYSMRVVEDIVSKYEMIFDDIEFLLLSGGVINNENFVTMMRERAEEYKVPVATPEKPQYAVAKGLYNLVCNKYGGK